MRKLLWAVGHTQKISDQLKELGQAEKYLFIYVVLELQFISLLKNCSFVDCNIPLASFKITIPSKAPS